MPITLDGESRPWQEFIVKEGEIDSYQIYFALEASKLTSIPSGFPLFKFNSVNYYIITLSLESLSNFQ